MGELSVTSQRERGGRHCCVARSFVSNNRGGKSYCDVDSKYIVSATMKGNSGIIPKIGGHIGTGIRTLVGGVIYCALLACIYIPLYCVGFLLIKKTLLVQKLRLWTKIGRTQAKLGLVSRRSRVSDVSQSSTEEEIDFLTHRSMAYLHRMTLWTPGEIVNTFLRKQKVPLISDKQLAYVIMSTVFAHSVAWDKERAMFRLLLEGFEDLFLFQGFYWDARHVLVSPDGKKIIIQVDGGKEFHSDDERHRADYDFAKLHVQVCLSYFAPGLSHNHVHFVFPSAVCVLGKKLLNRKGALYKLLSPHFRFTERINYQALRVGKATNNKRSLDRLFFLWQSFPVTKEQFLEGVARKCKKHYMDKGAQECSKATMPEEEENIFDDAEERRHFLFPPEYVTNKSFHRLPYLAFLREYYFVVRRFVQAMVPYIDKSEWDMLSEAIHCHVPRMDKVSMVDAITTFIHQVGVVHYCDHTSYLKYFAFKYGCMSITAPFETFQDTEHWDDISKQFGRTVDEIKHDPTVLIRQRDVMRTRCFLNIFVDYIPSSSCNLQLVTTDYGFEDQGAVEAANSFMSELRSLDGNLKIKEPPIHIPTGRGEHRGTGLQIVPLDDIVRTICF
ncbi:uncharacterized protein LOC100183334 isoform X1 [Ciona intestinalis]